MMQFSSFQISLFYLKILEWTISSDILNGGERMARLIMIIIIITVDNLWFIISRR